MRTPSRNVSAPPRLASSLLLASLSLVPSRVARAGSSDAGQPDGGTTEALEVEVRGGPSLPLKDPYVAGSVVPRDRLQAPGAHASDVLRMEPGVAVADTGGYGGLSTAAIRGATAAQTPVYLAGVRLNDDVAGIADLSLVPLWLLHRIEIYRSNAPLEADALGIGGAIFFEPRRPRGTEAGAGALAGSFGARGLWADVGAGSERAAALFGVRMDGARNDYTFVDDRGTRFDPTDDRRVPRTNADSRTFDAWALASAALGRSSRVDVLLNAVERRQGLPGLTLFPTTEARSSAARRLAAITVRLACGRAADGCEVTAVTTLLLARSMFDDPLRELALGSARVEIGGRRVEQAIRARVPVGAAVTLVPSVEAAIESLDVDTGAPTGLRAERVSSRAAMSGTWSPHQLVTVRATLAGECHGTGVHGRPPWALAGDAVGPAVGHLCGEAEPSARAGLAIGRPGLLGLVNVGRYARVPTLGERFGLSGVARGNTALNAEHGVTADLGIRAEGPDTGPLRGASLDAFGFARVASDLVAYQRSSLGYVRPFNVGAARVLGAELSAAYRPVRFFRADVAATFLDPRDVSPTRTTRNDVLPYQARLVLALRVTFSATPSWGILQTAKLVASYFHESSRYADPAGLVVLPQQGSLDLEGELGLDRDHLAIRVRIANALDQTRADLVGYPLPGRAAYATLESRW